MLFGAQRCGNLTATPAAIHGKKPLFNLLQRFALAGHANVFVDARGTYITMAEDGLGVAGVYGQLLLGRGVGVADAMQGDLRKIELLADAAERTEQVPCLDGVAAVGGEDESP